MIFMAASMIFMECDGRSCPGLARGWTGLSGCVELEWQKGSNMGNVETSNNFLRRTVRGFHPRRTSYIADTAIKSPGNVSIQETQRSACRPWLDAEQGRQNGPRRVLLSSKKRRLCRARTHAGGRHRAKHKLGAWDGDNMNIVKKQETCRTRLHVMSPGPFAVTAAGQRFRTRLA